MKKLKIGGVPEHFNAPWKYAIQQNLFSNKNILIDFKEYPDGTGALCHDLSQGILDMAIVLTEGVVKFQQQDPALKIISTYVETPLVWGIHIAKQSRIHSIDELKNKIFAISRFGSGSHLIIKLLAKQQDWDFSTIKLLEVGGIDNLCQALLDKKADVFLWEIFTTKPYLEKFQLKMLSTLPTLWPCFQIIARENIYNDKVLINNLCDTIFSVTKKFNQDHIFAVNQIQNYYNLEKEDILQWLKTVKWAEQMVTADLTIVEDLIQ